MLVPWVIMIYLNILLVNLLSFSFSSNLCIYHSNKEQVLVLFHILDWNMCFHFGFLWHFTCWQFGCVSLWRIEQFLSEKCLSLEKILNCQLLWALHKFNQTSNPPTSPFRKERLTIVQLTLYKSAYPAVNLVIIQAIILNQLSSVDDVMSHGSTALYTATLSSSEDDLVCNARLK